MKLSKGAWEHLEVAGHAPEELWQRFYDADGKWHAWSQSHVGEVIELQDGKAVDLGVCRFCGGSTHVKCALCQGTGEVTCPACGGQTTALPVAVGGSKPASPPKTIRLKSGLTLTGRTEMRIGSRVFVRTVDGQQLELEAGQILSETPIVETSKR